MKIRMFPLNMLKAFINKEKGLTLIEVTVAVMILSVALVGIASVIISTVKLNRLTQENIVAMNGIRAELNKVLALNFADVPAVDGQEFEIETLNPVSAEVGSISINTTDARLYRVTVRANWRGVIGEKNLEIIGFIAEPPPEAP